MFRIQTQRFQLTNEKKPHLEHSKFKKRKSLYNKKAIVEHFQTSRLKRDFFSLFYRRGVSLTYVWNKPYIFMVAVGRAFHQHRPLRIWVLFDLKMFPRDTSWWSCIYLGLVLTFAPFKGLVFEIWLDVSSYPMRLEGDVRIRISFRWRFTSSRILNF